MACPHSHCHLTPDDLTDCQLELLVTFLTLKTPIQLSKAGAGVYIEMPFCCAFLV